MLEQMWYLWPVYFDCRCISSQQKYSEGFFNNSLTSFISVSAVNTISAYSYMYNHCRKFSPRQGFIGCLPTDQETTAKNTGQWIKSPFLQYCTIIQLFHSSTFALVNLGVLGCATQFPPSCCHGFKHMHVFSTCTFVHFQCELHHSCRNWKVKGCSHTPTVMY